MKEVICIDKCTGCGACALKCPKNAIKMVEDELGTIHSEIDQNLCIDCGLCKKICPSVTLPKFNLPIKTYAAIAKDRQEYLTSTSGGVSAIFVNNVIGQGGVAYGTAVTDGLKVRQVRAENFEQAKSFKTSKYVFSNTLNSYSLVKEDLEKGIKVLYTGMSCQVAGLYGYLGKDYDNLITVNLICHGAPNAKSLEQHVQKVLRGRPANQISFRNKTGHYLTLKNDGQTVYSKSRFKDPYSMAFIRALGFRENCYNCLYARTERVGDFTIGDFWGFNEQKGKFPVQTEGSKSVIIVNTHKAQQFFESLKEQFIYVEREYAEAVAGNPRLKRPVVRHKKTGKFRKLFVKYGFTKSAKICLRSERLYYTIRKVLKGY